MFLSVKFNPSDSRTYTYIYDGAEQIEPGDFVIVETREGRKPSRPAACAIP